MARAHEARDASYDGVFWVCVKTTGIFCRPSCSARMPNRENVAYAFSVNTALADGFRPCKRCRPMEVDGSPPEWVKRLLLHADQSATDRIPDADLKSNGFDPVRVRRFFKQHYGVTFHTFHRNRRLATAAKDIQSGTPLLQVGMDAGYESDSGFRDAFFRTYGLTPGRFEDADHIVLDTIPSAAGPLVIAATRRGVCLVEFSDRRALGTEIDFLKKKFACPIVAWRNGFIDSIEQELSDYFEGTLKDFATPLDSPGTPFQRKVWDALRAIPYGQTTSYGELAKSLDKPGAQRAVGRANGANRIGIVIPCHRVVQSDGQLRGYGGGLWRKRFLLMHEKNHLHTSVEETGDLSEYCQA
ncbi:MAG: methylated-DNA--[protein]-cysteine S-methyltransferase [Planctomycetes bacterium]|nr:methylated-DNA--[protein]-cysteine S-methyltransferase [Planctomycetota bacterium]